MLSHTTKSHAQNKSADKKAAPAKRGTSANDAMLDNLVKEPAGPTTKLGPAPGESQAPQREAAEAADKGYTDPPQGRTVLAQKDGVPMLVQFKITAHTGPTGGFFSQMGGGFTNFEGKVDGWVDLPDIKHRKAAPR